MKLLYIYEIYAQRDANSIQMPISYMYFGRNLENRLNYFRTTLIHTRIYYRRITFKRITDKMRTQCIVNIKYIEQDKPPLIWKRPKFHKFRTVQQINALKKLKKVVDETDWLRN